MRYAVLLAIFSISVLATGCNKKAKDNESKPTTAAQTVKNETMEAYEAFKSYATKKHEEYREKTEAALKSYERRFAELKTKGDKGSSSAKKKYREAEEAWQEKTKAVREQLEELKTASIKTWEQMEKKIDAGIDELKKLYEKARSAIA
jgi:hypothetical protein